MNLHAGKKVAASAAYPIALNYFNFGLKLLPSNAWEAQYDLTLNLYTHAAEAAYLSDQFDESRKLADIALAHAHSLSDQVNVYKTKIYTKIAHN